MSFAVLQAQVSALESKVKAKDDEIAYLERQKEEADKVEKDLKAKVARLEGEVTSLRAEGEKLKSDLISKFLRIFSDFIACSIHACSKSFIVILFCSVCSCGRGT